MRVEPYQRSWCLPAGEDPVKRRQLWTGKRALILSGCCLDLGRPSLQTCEKYSSVVSKLPIYGILLCQPEWTRVLSSLSFPSSLLPLYLSIYLPIINHLIDQQILTEHLLSARSWMKSKANFMGAPEANA